ncbi:MAG: hypothetical protein WC374_02425 [Phycisphaerae bacterium]|jgi:hypothetical protein
MSLISQGINNVRVFNLPQSIWPDGRCFAAPRTALVKWRSSWTDKIYQIYVNGSFAGATVDFYARQLVVALPRSPMTAVRVEVFAVEPKYAHIDFSSELSQQNYTGRVKLKILRSQRLPLESQIQIYFDNGTGDIDYDNPINAEPIFIWTSVYDKAGFAMSRFGQGDFGFDSAAAIGLGLGDFGLGDFGIDADSLEWISEPLNRGVYKFALVVIDGFGNQSEPVESELVTVIPDATPATSLAILSFDKQTSNLVLSVN